MNEGVPYPGVSVTLCSFLQYCLCLMGQGWVLCFHAYSHTLCASPRSCVYQILMLTNFPFRLIQQRTDETRNPPTYKSGTPSHPIFCVNPTSFTPASFVNV